MQGKRPPTDTRLALMIREHLRLVQTLLRRHGVRTADVDDVSQDVFLTLARCLPAIERDSERSYLAAVTLRAAGHARRSYHRRAWMSCEVDCEPEARGPLPDELTELRRALLQGHGALAALPECLATPFLLFELEGWSVEAIARMLAIPPGTIKSRLRRARRELTRAAVERRVS